MTRLGIDTRDKPGIQAAEAQERIDYDMPEPKVTLPSGMAVQIVTWIVAALLTYGAINARVSVLEDRVNGMKETVAEIRGDVKTLLQRK